MDERKILEPGAAGEWGKPVCSVDRALGQRKVNIFSFFFKLIKKKKVKKK